MTSNYIPTARICCFIGDGTGCEMPVETGRNYCINHLWSIYRKGTATATRKKDIRTANRVWDLQSAFNEAIAELEAEGFDCYANTSL